MEQVGRWIEEASFSIEEVSRISGVSRTQIHRILNGSSSPTISTLAAIARACGVSFRLESYDIVDFDAVTAARSLLEQEIRDTLPDPVPESINYWIKAFKRNYFTGKTEFPYTRILREAGLRASFRDRQDIKLFTGAAPALYAASAAQATGDPWAISEISPLGLGDDTQTLVYVSPRTIGDIRTKLNRHYTPTENAAEATLIVVPTTATTLIATTQEYPINWVSPVQNIIDNFAIRTTQRDEYFDHVTQELGEKHDQ